MSVCCMLNCTAVSNYVSLTLSAVAMNMVLCSGNSNGIMIFGRLHSPD